MGVLKSICFNGMCNEIPDMDGYYPNLHVGTADQLLADTYTTDEEPYRYRQTPSHAGTREIDEIIGGSVVWNQLVNTSTSSVTVTSGHKYVAKISDAWSVGTSAGTALSVTGGTDMVFDITQMFPSTIADHIYDLEQATAGAGVAFFRKYFPEEYYAYDEGTIRSVEGLVSHNMVGFNLFDKASVINNSWLSTSTGLIESGYNDFAVSDYIRVLKGVDIYIPDLGSARRWFYTNDKKPHTYIGRSTAQIFTPPQDGYIRVTINKTTNNINDICINLSNTAKNGTYEPYEKNSYPLDNSVTLRGIPQLVDGQLKFDGDTYSADGVVTRRYGIVDLGTLTWNYNSTDLFTTVLAGFVPKNYSRNGNNHILCSAYPEEAWSKIDAASGVTDKTLHILWSSGTSSNIWIADSAYSTASEFKSAMLGVMLVYELATPTTKQAEHYQSLQICSPYGTEEYVSTSIVPIGHYTKYPTNLKSIVEKIADAPSADGTYTLKATVSNGVVTYSWESANG